MKTYNFYNEINKGSFLTPPVTLTISGPKQIAQKCEYINCADLILPIRQLK